MATPFDHIMGQEFAQRLLKSAVRGGRPASAYLFYGPPGCGKKSVARAMTAALFCKVTPGVGCATCVDCRRVAQDKHPDARVIAPQGASFKVEQVRDLLHEASLKPYEAGTRVFIVDRADSLTPGAANAMLKALEEPAPNTLYVLVTSQRAAILSTIASRCQPVRFTALPDLGIAELLRQIDNVDPIEAKRLAGLSGGSLRQARRLAAPEGRHLIELAEGFLEAAALKSRLRALAWARSADEDRKRLPELLPVLAMFLRELWMDRAGMPASLRLLGAAPQHGKSLPKEVVLRLIGAVAQAQTLIPRNVHAGLILDNLALAMEDRAAA